MHACPPPSDAINNWLEDEYSEVGNYGHLLLEGRGKSVVCMDGLDLSDMLIQKIGFKSVLSKKVRRAAETGKPFVRLRDLM